MPVFMVERDFADKLELDDETVRLIDEYNDENEINWITTFLSADQKKTYCLYECDDIDVLRRHAADLGLPIDAITEVAEFQR